MPGKLDKQAKVKRVLRGLRRMYGDRPFVRVGTGLDTLIEAMLSQNTNMANASRGFKLLRRQFPTWAKVLVAPAHEVQRCIAICGLARMRARRLQDLLGRIRAERRGLSIEFLREMNSRQAYEWLMRFH